MNISIFLTGKLESSFDLGGLEFDGLSGSFTKENYASQDFQMVFILLSDFAYAMRKDDHKFTLSGRITINYDNKSQRLYVNQLLIEKMPYLALMEQIKALIENAIDMLASIGIHASDFVLSDLQTALVELNLLLNG